MFTLSKLKWIFSELLLYFLSWTFWAVLMLLDISIKGLERMCIVCEMCIVLKDSDDLEEIYSSCTDFQASCYEVQKLSLHFDYKLNLLSNDLKLVGAVIVILEMWIVASKWFLRDVPRWGRRTTRVFRDGNVPYSVKEMEMFKGICSEWSLYLTQTAESRL